MQAPSAPHKGDDVMVMYTLETLDGDKEPRILSWHPHRFNATPLPPSHPHLPAGGRENSFFLPFTLNAPRASSRDTFLFWSTGEIWNAAAGWRCKSRICSGWWLRKLLHCIFFEKWGETYLLENTVNIQLNVDINRWFNYCKEVSGHKCSLLYNIFKGALQKWDILLHKTLNFNCVRLRVVSFEFNLKRFCGWFLWASTWPYVFLFIQALSHVKCVYFQVLLDLKLFIVRR